jgi:glycosidase
MNYDFFFAVRGLLKEERSTVTEFYQELSRIKGKVHYKVYPLLWNLLDSHDTERFYNGINYDKKKMKLASAFQLLSPGMPLVYYGDEYGMHGGGDPDSRRGMYWDKKYQDLELYDWYRNLISVRKKHAGILDYTDVDVKTDDEAGLLRIEKKGYVILYNTKAKEIFVDELKLKMELITGDISDGYMEGYSVFVYKK